jgi:anti-sigma-K factor RskA
MNYDNPQTRTALAAEYVLGTLHGRSRLRFEQILQSDAALRREVERWQNDLYPGLLDALPEHSPPERIWQVISSQTRNVVPFRSVAPRSIRSEDIDTSQQRSRVRENWQQLATAAVLLLTVYLVLDVAVFPPAPPAAQVLQVTLSDSAALPAWSVSLERAQRQLSVRTLRTQTLTAANSFELWMLPGADQPPVSLGLIPPSGETTLALTAEQSATLLQAGGLVVSLEPAGGSPTGQPTGPILYQGVIEPAA